MNPYAFRNRLSKFGSPQQLVADASNAQQLPGQAAGNVAGQQDNDPGVFMPPGTPAAPQQNPNGGGNPFANDPAGALGGQMQAPSMMNSVNVGADYSNEYGTSIRGNYNPMTGRIEAAGTVPIGDYQNGLTVGGGVYYNPQTQDYGGALRFGKRNNVPAPGTQPFKYSMGLNVDGQRVPVGSNMNQGRRPMQIPGMGSTNMNQVPGMSTLGEPESNLLLSPQQKRLMMEQMSRQGGVPGEAPGFNPGVR